MGRDPRFARVVVGDDGRKIKVPAHQIDRVIETLLTTYKTERQKDDTFARWAQRQELSRRRLDGDGDDCLGRL